MHYYIFKKRFFCQLTIVYQDSVNTPKFVIERNTPGAGSLNCKLQCKKQIEIQTELWVGAQDKRLWPDSVSSTLTFLFHLHLSLARSCYFPAVFKWYCNYVMKASLFTNLIYDTYTFLHSPDWFFQPPGLATLTFLLASLILKDMIKSAWRLIKIFLLQ